MIISVIARIIILSDHGIFKIKSMIHKITQEIGDLLGLASSSWLTTVAAGGTIASLGRGRLDLANYGDTRNIMHADEITQAVPELAEIAEIVPIRFRNMPAIEIGPKDWLDLNRAVHAAAAANPPPTGIVVTHGTATLEETAYFLSLALKIRCPVVVTGSQRPFSAVSSEAPLNLISAVRVAASPGARGLGVLVVLNEEIHAAREVTKTDTYRVQAFQAPGLGALGYADSDRIAIYRAPLRQHTERTPFDVRGAKIGRAHV